MGFHDHDIDSDPRHLRKVKQRYS